MASPGFEVHISRETIEVLKSRRSVRIYGRKPIPRQIIEDIIDCGRSAATAANIQPWEFVVVTHPDTLRRLAKTADCEGFIAEAPVCVVVLCRKTKYYLEDGSAATQNILLAAHAYGLDSCWVAGDKKSYALDICRLVGAPLNCKLISLVSLGYPEDSPVTTKRPLQTSCTGRSTESEGE